jgi:hypothetical protein
MTKSTRPRTTVQTRAEPRAGTPLDRLFQSLGVEPQFADNVLGDLAEEFAMRKATDGVGSARWWYVGEAIRSTPHLVWSAVRHGNAQQRARLAAGLTGFALAVSLTIVAVVTRDGPPTRLVADHDADRLVINNLQPMQLPIRVLDDAGHRLPSDSVRFTPDAGSALTVSATGAVTCVDRGDATIRASLGSISTVVAVRCLPVREIESSTWVSLIAGEPARHLPFKAIGTDGQPVTELRGSALVSDGAVATLVGGYVVPRSVGATKLIMAVGDRTAHIRVVVHEPVRRFDNLRADQRFVAVPVRVVRGETIDWTLPDGVFWLKYIPKRAGDAPPTIVTDGRVSCAPGDGLRDYLLPPDEHGTYGVRQQDGPASVRVSHGHVGAGVVEGWLALERVERS